MTVNSFAQAMREIEALMRNAWPYKVAWPGTNFDTKKDVTAKDTWARYTIQHNFGDQSSLSDTLGKRRFNKEGNLIIQVFTPLNKGVISAYDAAEIVVKAYEGKSTPSGVWFRNVRINEVPSEGSWEQINVIVDFIYDQIH